MPVEVSDDRVVLRFEMDHHLELNSLRDSLGALENQYHKALIDKGLEPRDLKAKLYVTRLESGSLETEIAFWFLMAKEVWGAMDYTNVAFDFAERVRQAVDYLSGKKKDGNEPKRPNFDKADIDDYERILRPIAGRKGAGLAVRQVRVLEKTGERELIAEYDFGEHDLSNALMNVSKERENLEKESAPKHHIEKNVLFVWHQTNKDKGKSAGRTSDRAVVSKVSSDPLPVFFPAEQSLIKQQMTRIEGNPLFTGFMVDVEVQYVDEQPKVYTILQMHQPIDLAPGEDE